MLTLSSSGGGRTSGIVHARLSTHLNVLLTLLLFMGLSSVHLYAQYGLGSVTGTVTDNSGAAVPKAKVEVMNLDTAVVTRTQTSSDGIYNLTAIAPGSYKMTVTKEGFEVTVVDKVLVLADQIVSSDVKLMVGKTTTTVSVSAKAPLLSATEQNQATTEESSLVKNLPFPERSALESAFLVAGVIGDPSNGPGGMMSENPGIYTGYIAPGAQLGIGGAPQGSSAVMIDGSDVTQTSLPRQGNSVSGDNVEEVTVVTGGISAQYGNTIGGAVSMTTKGGTNLLHGGVTYRHTDPSMQSFPLGGTLPASLHQNFLGGYLGGPVEIPKVYNGRDKTFFYLSYEPARLENAISGLANFPTEGDAQGCFYNTLALINTTVLAATPPSGETNYQAALAAARTGQLWYKAPLNSNGFPYGPNYYTSASQYQAIGASANPACGGNIDDVSAQLALNPWANYISQNFPSPQNPGPYIAYLYPNGYWNSSSQNIAYARGVINDDNRFSVRIDRVLSANDHMFARYTDIPLTSSRFLGVPPTSPMNVSPNDQSWGKDFALNESHVFSPSLVNELRLMYMRNHQIRTQGGAAIAQDWATQFNLIQPTIGYGWPAASYGYAQAAGLASGLLLNVDYTYQLGDDLTWTRGKHSIKFGIDIRHMGSNQNDLNGIYGGTYSFSTGQTNNGTSGGSAYASMDLGWISSFSDTPIEIPAYYRWHYYAGYVQDDWKVLPHLTLNLGLRYEMETPRMEKYDNQGTFIPTIQGTLNGQPATGAYCFSETCGLGKTLWPINYTGFEPRIGIAWQPTRLMTVRASYGMLRAPITGLGNTVNPDFNVAAQAVGGQTGGVIPNSVVSTVNNLPGTLTSSLTPFLGKSGPYFSVIGFTPPFVEQKAIVPYAQQWSLTLQYQLSHSSMISVSYNGLMGQHLISLAVAPALNAEPLGPILQGVAGGENFNLTKPNPYGITNYGSTSVNSESYFQALEPYQNFYNQSLAELYNRGGESIYHALYINYTQRLRGGISLISSFTWSKTMDDGGQGQNTNGLIGYDMSCCLQFQYDLRADRSLAMSDIPARFTMGYSWDIPLGANRMLSTHNKYIDAAVGHWTTGGIFDMRDSWPWGARLGSAGYFVSTGGGTVLPPNITLQPNIVPGQSCVNPTWKENPFAANSYINPNMFTMPGSLGDPQFGDAGRLIGSCRGPRQTTWNANLLRRFPLGLSEKRYFEVGLQAQNVLNHPVFMLQNSESLTRFSAFNTASITNSAVPAFTEGANFGNLLGSWSANFNREVSIYGRLFF